MDRFKRVARTYSFAGVLLLILTLSETAFGESLVNGGVVSGAISLPGEEDSYTFTANTGDGIQLQVADLSGTAFSPTMYVYDPTGMVVASGGFNAWTASSDGTYSVVVFDGTSGGSQTGDYNLYFTRAPGANEGGELVNGGVVSDHIDLRDLDSYTFTANIGEGIQLQIAGTSFSPTMYVYDPMGTRVTGGAFLAWPAEASGTYTVVVFDGTQSRSQTGDYNLYFTRAPGANEGGSLVNGGVVSEHIDLRDLDSYTFTANSGEGIQLQIADLSGTSFSPIMYVYDPTGKRIIGGGFLAWSAEASGTYTVVVFDASGSRVQTGDYNLYFTRAPGANEGGALVNGEVVLDRIDLRDLDSYTFAANAGESVHLQLTDLSNTALSPHMYLYGPHGARLAGGAQIDFQISESGVYTVVVFDSSGSRNQTGDYSLAFSIDNDFLSYAALGDSYSSGEGVRPYENPGEAWNEGCHRSTRAYPKLLRAPGTSQPISRRNDALFDFYACTGAVVNNVRASGEGQYGEPPQLAAVNHVDSTRDLVTMSIGGNDAYFAWILGFCFAHEACNEIQPFQPFSDIQLGDLFPLLAAVVETKLLDVYAELREATPNAPTLIMEYPLVVGGKECAAAKVPFADHLALSESEQAWMRDANRQLNAVIQAATIARGLHFVPVAEHFDGHEVCGRFDDWILGLNLIDRERLWDPKASFHPTARGQYEMARVANAYLESISIGWPFGYHASGLPRNPPPLLPAATAAAAEPTSPLPSFGELNVSFANAPQACAAVGGTITPGAMVALRGAGFAPNESIQISLKLVGEANMVLGDVVADAEGSLDAVIDLPESLNVGAQGALQALGAGPDGVGRLLLALVQVQSSLSVDGDGDGVPDSCDNCPNASNTDQSDLDFDGQGDACDLCTQDPDNDVDGDGLCATVDACPLDPDNDIDGDGRCALEDNCAITPNPDQADGDGNGIGDACEALACYSVGLSVHQAGAGNVTADATNCGLDAYFEGTLLSLRADPEPGQLFTGWSGDLSTAENPLSVTVTADTTLTAHFCSETTDGDGDWVADACDNCPADPNSDQRDTDGDGSGNACDNDDDNDGLLDIYETNTGVYISPTDTGTDPLSVDTDGDGVDDFQEIQNGTDPTIPNASLEIGIKLGFNLISYPFDSDANPVSCIRFLDQLGAAEASSILQLDAATQQFVTCDRTTGAVFSMTTGIGYVINSRQDADVLLSGEIICPALNLAPGINLVGNPSPASDLSCYELLVELAPHGVRSMQRYDWTRGFFETCALTNTDAPVGVDFSIRPGEGYLAHSTESIHIDWPHCTQ